MKMKFDLRFFRSANNWFYRTKTISGIENDELLPPAQYVRCETSSLKVGCRRSGSKRPSWVILTASMERTTIVRCIFSHCPRPLPIPRAMSSASRTVHAKYSRIMWLAVRNLPQNRPCQVDWANYFGHRLISPFADRFKPLEILPKNKTSGSLWTSKIWAISIVKCWTVIFGRVTSCAPSLRNTLSFGKWPSIIRTVIDSKCSMAFKCIHMWAFWIQEPARRSSAIKRDSNWRSPNSWAN